MECPVLDRQWLPLRLPQEEEDLKPTLWRPFAFLDSDSIEQDYLLERNTSFPSIPSSSFDLIQGEEDNDCAALLKDHTATAAAASPPYLSRTSRTEDLSNRSEKENQSTNKQLSVDIDSRYTDSEDERANECRLVSPRTNTSSKRHRATHVHNLSEKRSKLEDFSANQRRRNRFNEKLKALQLLIPNSQKTDKASILEEAIQYVKQLQLQVQMLSSPNKMNPSHTCVPVGIPCFQMPQMFMNMGINMAHSHSQWNNGFMIVPQRVQGQTILPWAN